ncbi:hypothetical protein H4R33_006776, partial [Dimargaris cristalligena]
MAAAVAVPLTGVLADFVTSTTSHRTPSPSNPALKKYMHILNNTVDKRYNLVCFVDALPLVERSPSTYIQKITNAFSSVPGENTRCYKFTTDQWVTFHVNRVLDGSMMNYSLAQKELYVSSTSSDAGTYVL